MKTLQDWSLSSVCTAFILQKGQGHRAWRFDKLLGWLACILALSAAGYASAQSSEPSPVDRMRGQSPDSISKTQVEGKLLPGREGVRAQAQRRLPQSQPTARVVLDRVGAAQLNMEATAQASTPGAPLKIGFSRDVPQLRTTSQASALMVWTGVQGGQLAAISITSPDALGLRLGLLVEKLPATALLRFYAQEGDQVFEVSGREIMETIARNMAAGDKTDEGRTYWSPVIDGQEVTVEIELPMGVSVDEVMISIPRVSHLFSSPLNTRALQEQIGGAALCNLDSMCYQPTWEGESGATAKMVYTSGGGSHLCTGTLMLDWDSTGIPYFLSADHCISTQTEASSLQTIWFYRSTSCNSGTVNPGNQTLTTGATLLYQSSATDTSFMKLNSAPQGAAWYSGWSASLPALSNSVAGIHNPWGDLQKISFGAITGYDNCVSNGDGTFHCTSASPANATFLTVVDSQGITEPGSSGSGLWVTSGGSHYLVGQLYGGSNSCSAPSAPVYYGSFGVAYNAALYKWLGSGAATSYTLSVAKSGAGSGTVTSSPAGISCGATCSAGFTSGTSVTLAASPAVGSNFTGWSGACAGTGSCIVTMNAAQNVTAAFDAAVAAVSLSPTSLSFSAQAVGTTSAAKTVTLTNTGGAVLSIGSIVANGNFARSTTCGATLAQATSCTIGITFTPSAASSYLSTLVITSSAASSPNTVSLSGTGTAVVTVPVCSLTANPALIFADGSSKLTASCTPAATSYAWTGGTCASQSANSCTVTPAATTSYTVQGINAVGSGNIASASVSVVAPTAGLYDGIYLWSLDNYYLSVHQDGTTMIATIYFNNDGSFSFPATSGGGTLSVPQIDIFDLMNGQVTGSTVTMYGVRFHRACNVAYNFTFNSDATLTVVRTGVSNTAAADAAGISCSAIIGLEPSTMSVPKIRFYPDSAPVANAGLYDGIYLWSLDNHFLSLHQDGTTMIAPIYFNNDGNFNFPAPAGGGALPVPTIDLFDLMNGQMTGSTGQISGDRFHRACHVGYNFTFNNDATITVTRTSVSNNAAANSAGISCSAIVGLEPVTLIVPKIRFNQ